MTSEDHAAQLLRGKALFDALPMAVQVKLRQYYSEMPLRGLQVTMDYLKGKGEEALDEAVNALENTAPYIKQKREEHVAEILAEANLLRTPEEQEDIRAYASHLVQEQLFGRDSKGL